jgi:hypothetical protein
VGDGLGAALLSLQRDLGWENLTGALSHLDEEGQ